MANEYIRAAANSLLKAAADKRNEEREIQRQADDLRRQTDLQQRMKQEEIKSQQKLIAYDPQAPQTTYLNKRIHDAHDELKKLIELSKTKMQELTKYSADLEAQAKNLEVESRSLQMRS